MMDTRLDTTTHLVPEAVERIALGAEPAPAERGHLASCGRCRREVGELGTLHASLAHLPPLAPASDFADRVMARVRLPEPAWVRTLAGLRSSPRRALATAAALVAAVLGAATWAVAYPQLTPVQVATFVFDRGTTLVWQAVISAARVVYDSGLTSLMSGVRADLSVWSATGALATLALVGFGSLWIMLRLLDVSPRLLRSGTGRRG